MILIILIKFDGKKFVSKYLTIPWTGKSFGFKWLIDWIYCEWSKIVKGNLNWMNSQKSKASNIFDIIK